MQVARWSSRKRGVKHKRVVILLDSITCLGRAYNTVTPTAAASHRRRGFHRLAVAAPVLRRARNIEEGGSLTIVATALVETGSRMDEVIFEEFKGTGNMQVVLDRRLFTRRTFPAIDVTTTSTRKEELLLSEYELSRSWILRRILNQMGVTEGMEFLLERMRGTKTNTEFLKAMNE